MKCNASKIKIVALRCVISFEVKSTKNKGVHNKFHPEMKTRTRRQYQMTHQ